MFTARVIHSLPLMTSVVHVYYHDLLSVVCHLIGPDTLPTPAQVGDKRLIRSYYMINASIPKLCVLLLIPLIPLFMKTIRVKVGFPSLPQVNSSFENLPVTLSQQDGERAMIIKNNDGDWAVLIGRWTGVKKGKPGVRGNNS